LFKKCNKDINIERKPSQKDRNIEFELQGVLGKTGPASDPPTQTRPEILFQFDGGTVATSRQYKWPMGLNYLFTSALDCVASCSQCLVFTEATDKKLKHQNGEKKVFYFTLHIFKAMLI
jgi:hypothetical protein